MKKIIFLLSLMTISLSNAQDLTVASGALLTIANEGGVYVTGDLENSGTTNFTSKSDAFGALIVKGNVSNGNSIYYKRYVDSYVNALSTGVWDLISAPLQNSSINSFVTDNTGDIATAAISNGVTHYALRDYDHVNDTWVNHTSVSVPSAGNFDLGMGHQMASVHGNTLTFEGLVPLADQTQSIINNYVSSVISPRGQWNLIGNPFPSYLNVNISADAANNFLSLNSGVIDANFLCVYKKRADGSSYDIYNNTSGHAYINPGEGFWVAASRSTPANIVFTEAMQTFDFGDNSTVLDPNDTSSEFYLKLYEGQNYLKADTKFYFDEDLNYELDPGYDAGAFNQSMELMSSLPTDDQGIGMSINAVSSDIFNTTDGIPLIVNRPANIPFRLSLEDSTLDADVDVYLYDKQQGTYTDLSFQDFTLTPTSNLSGKGRFYVVFSPTSLGVNDLDDNLDISIYKAFDQNQINIEGLTNVNFANVQLYNIIGQEVLNKRLAANKFKQSIPTTGLKTGIYILKLEADAAVITKKLIIN
jgi:hypothetical protein